jgi:hypothetical protein
LDLFHFLIEKLPIALNLFILFINLSFHYLQIDILFHSHKLACHKGLHIPLDNIMSWLFKLSHLTFYDIYSIPSNIGLISYVICLELFERHLPSCLGWTLIQVPTH